MKLFEARIYHSTDDPPTGGAPAQADTFDENADDKLQAMLNEELSVADPVDDEEDDDDALVDPNEDPESPAADPESDPEQADSGQADPTKPKQLTDEEILALRPDLADRLKPVTAEPDKPTQPASTQNPQERFKAMYAEVAEANRERIEEARYGDAVEMMTLQEELRAETVQRLQQQDFAAEQERFVQRAETEVDQIRDAFIKPVAGDDEAVRQGLLEELSGYDPIQLLIVHETPEYKARLERRMDLIAKGLRAEAAAEPPRERRAAPSMGNARAPGGQRAEVRTQTDRQVEAINIEIAMEAAQMAGKPITEAEARRQLARN